MRYIVLLLLTVVFFSSHAYADNPGQLAIKMIPGIITQNTEGLIEVYSQSGGTIDKLVATSYDPSIVQITGMDPGKSHTVYIVKINTQKDGTTKIAFAAPGFSSEEFPVVVTKNSGLASQLLIQTTPSTFDLNGPTHGYFSVETVNAGGFPTAVQNDLPISVSTSNTNIASLRTDQVVIKNGTYYAMGEFDVNQPGTVTISASSQTMQTVSSTSITVNNVNTQNTIQLYVYPQKINVFSATYAYAVVQLHGSSGNPILAKEDIPVTITVKDTSNTKLNNTSGQTPYVQVNETPVIKKGSYWAYVPVEVVAGTNDPFSINISVKGYLVSTPALLTPIMQTSVFADNSAKIDVLPVLATGQKELIGIAHLEDNSGNVLVAKDNLQIHVDSSSTPTISVLDIALPHGSQAAPVFAQVGNVVNPVSLNVVTETPQTVTPTMTAPTTDSLTLIVQSLIPKVLTHTTFPLLFFMEKSGVLSSFPSDFEISVEPTSVIQAGPVSISKDKPIQVVNSTLLQDGVQSLSVGGSPYSPSFTIEGLSSHPASIMMDFPDTIISNTPNAFSIELLDGQKLPVYADHDIDAKLISSDPSILDFSDVQIKKGTYYTTFNAQANKSGSVDISILADVIPLSKFTMSVVSFTPDVSIDSPDFSEPNIPFSASITALYKQAPLDGLKVEWSVDGAIIQKMNSTTNSEGIATATFVASNPGTVHVTAKISGGSYGDTVVSKDVKVNPPLSSNTSSISPSSSSPSLSILGISPILLIIPVVAGVVIFMYFKKREILVDKISTIKEKIMNLRQRE